MIKLFNQLFAVFRICYGLFFLGVVGWVAISLGAGLLPMFEQTAPSAADFSHALDRTGFMNPLMALSFVVGGAALLFSRTTPLGVVLLAPSVTVIFFFHLFLTGHYLWGSFWAFGLIFIAWRCRSAFRPLWTYGETEKRGMVA